jgi:hypothetical protein
MEGNAPLAFFPFACVCVCVYLSRVFLLFFLLVLAVDVYVLFYLSA